jgi:hypothetical protein
MKKKQRKFLFAGKTFLVKTNNKKINQLLDIYCFEFTATKKTDFTLKYFFREGNFDENLYILKNEWRSDEKVLHKSKNLIEIKSRKGKKSKLLSSVIDLKKNQAKTEIKTSKNFFWNFFVFNLAKIIAIYLNQHNGNIIHSSAIATKKHGFLFAGENDAGKTSILMLCPETNNLGEDLNFLFKKGNKFFVQSFPLISALTNLNKKTLEPFELKAVFFLSKSKKIKLKKLARTEAIVKLLKNDIQGTFNFQKIKIKERMTLYEELFKKIPAFTLYFPLKKGLWKKIERKIINEVDLK